MKLPWRKKKKQTVVRQPSPEEMLRIMEKEHGRFVVESAIGFEAMLALKGEARQRVSAIVVATSRPTEHQLRALSKFPNLASLAFLCHERGAISSMIKAPHTLPLSITHLDLSGTRLHAGDADILCKEGVFPPSLTDLNLHGNFLGDEGVAALSRPGVLPVGLTCLNLARQQDTLSSAGVESLATAALPNLQELSLAYNHMGPTGAANLVTATFIRTLTRLDMNGCGIGMEGAGILIDHRDSFVNLRILKLSFNKLGRVACYSLEESFQGLDMDKEFLHSNVIRYYNCYGLNPEYWSKEDYEAEQRLDEDTRTREQEFLQQRRLNSVYSPSPPISILVSSLILVALGLAYAHFNDMALA